MQELVAAQKLSPHPHVVSEDLTLETAVQLLDVSLRADCSITNSNSLSYSSDISAHTCSLALLARMHLSETWIPF